MEGWEDGRREKAKTEKEKEAGGKRDLHAVVR